MEGILERAWRSMTATPAQRGPTTATPVEGVMEREWRSLSRSSLREEIPTAGQKELTDDPDDLDAEQVLLGHHDLQDSHSGCQVFVKRRQLQAFKAMNCSFPIAPPSI